MMMMTMIVMVMSNNRRWSSVDDRDDGVMNRDGDDG